MTYKNDKFHLKPKSYKYFIDYCGYVKEKTFINAWIEYINEESVIDKHFDKELFENDSLDSYGREYIKNKLRFKLRF